MQKTVQHGGDAGGIGKDLVPFLENSVGGDDQRFAFITAIDYFKEDVGGLVVIGQVPDFVNAEKSHVGITTEFASAPFDALGLEIFEDRWGGAEQHRVPGEHGRMAYVFGDQGFSQAVTADQHQIACLLQEVQAEGAFNDIAIDLGRPVPLEVGQEFKAFDGRQAQSPFQATAGTFLELASAEFFQKHVGGPACFARPGEEVVQVFW